MSLTHKDKLNPRYAMKLLGIAAILAAIYRGLYMAAHYRHAFPVGILQMLNTVMSILAAVFSSI
ncbi:hypothetical protein HZC00_04195 [Candidatus Kaiserbacteria bacterium]|nr:hypothetical protein [Candidatus Kaiserbacteria bacterium]